MYLQHKLCNIYNYQFLHAVTFYKTFLAFAVIILDQSCQSDLLSNFLQNFIAISQYWNLNNWNTMHGNAAAVGNAGKTFSYNIYYFNAIYFIKPYREIKNTWFLNLLWDGVASFNEYDFRILTLSYVNTVLLWLCTRYIDIINTFKWLVLKQID